MGKSRLFPEPLANGHHRDSRNCFADAAGTERHGPKEQTPDITARATRTRRRGGRRSRGSRYGLYISCAGVAALLPVAAAQSCISLAASTQCPAFNASSISTDTTLTGLFPFLSSVTDTSSFDTGIQQYIADGFTQQRYQQLIGCSSVNLSNTTGYYARYTTSVLCNAIVQNSINPCNLGTAASRPLCADTCAQYTASEQSITQTTLCGTTGPNAQQQIRADFTNCALPANSLTGTCIEGVVNQPDNCGFSSNLGGLCSYCSSSSPNATDSCCLYSDTETRCPGVVLPIALPSSSSSSSSVASGSTASSTPSQSATSATGQRRGFSAGEIAGIVVGSVLGAFALLALLILGCILLRRRKRSSPASSTFGHPSPTRQAQPQMAMHDGAASSQRDQLEALPGGRVARMAAIESSDGHMDRRSADSIAGMDKRPPSFSEGDSPESGRAYGLGPPPKRSGSLTSASVLGMTTDESSPDSRDQFSSPEGTTESERLDFFKDYYSQDEIRPGDLVSTLWAYQPRAQDEFELERGDMIKIVGIWDDGWATGVRVRLRAEDWRDGVQVQRDSGMSTGSSGTSSPASPDADSEVKAFPLVCVSLPQHWRKTIEGDSTQGSGGMRLPGSP